MPNIKEIKVADYGGNISIVKIKFVDKPERLTDEYYPVKTGTLETFFYLNEEDEKKNKISRYNLFYYLLNKSKSTEVISIEIPDGIEYIDEDSFNQYMKNLKLLTLPDGIKEIDPEAFYRIYPKYIITPKNPVVEDFFKPGGEFQKKYGKYLKKSSYKPPKIFYTRDEFDKFLSDKKYKIEITGQNDEVKEFEFNFNTPFAEINKALSDQIIKFASDNGIKIKKIKIPDGIESIDQEAFNNILDLEEVCFPSNIDYVWMGAFSRCKNLHHAEIKNIDIDRHFSLFYDAENLESVRISPQAAKKLFRDDLKIEGERKLKLKFIFIDGEEGFDAKYRKCMYNLISDDAIFFDNLDDFEKARKEYRAQQEKNKTPDPIKNPVIDENNNDDKKDEPEDNKHESNNNDLDKDKEKNKTPDPVDNKNNLVTNCDFDFESKELMKSKTKFKYLACGSGAVVLSGVGLFFVLNPVVGSVLLIIGLGSGSVFVFCSKKSGDKQKLVNICALIKKEKNGHKIIASDKNISLFLDKTNNSSLKNKISDIKKMFGKNNSPGIESYERKENLL